MRESQLRSFRSFKRRNAGYVQRGRDEVRGGGTEALALQRVTPTVGRTRTDDRANMDNVRGATGAGDDDGLGRSAAELGKIVRTTKR